jgi:hypothetical protein
MPQAVEPKPEFRSLIIVEIRRLIEWRNGKKMTSAKNTEWEVLAES